MGQLQLKTFDDILERMINRVVARTVLTDIEDTSSLKQVLAAAARELDEIYFQMFNLLDLFDLDKAIGEDLDERAKDFNPELVSRRQARVATGSVVFSRTGTTGTVNIPSGTVVKVPAAGAAAEILFTTTDDGEISSGFTDSSAIDIQALVAGEVGNVSPNTIVGFQVKPVGTDSVTNAAALTNGADIESDDAFRERIRQQISGLARAHIDGVETAALTVEDTGSGKKVLFAQILEDVLAPGTAKLYIDDGSGTAETTSPVTGEVVLASALGGETVLYLSNKPVKDTAAFILRLNAAPLVQGTDYSLNPASGQINLLPDSFPSGLSPADTVDADYTHFTGLIQLTQKVIDGDPADRVNFPGYRAAGCLIQVLAPQIVQIVINADVSIRTGFNQASTITAVEAAISGYINSLGISEDVIRNEIVERAMAVSGVFDITLNSPTENRVVLDDQLARVQSGNITII